MALTKDQKKAQVEDLRDKLARTKSLVFMRYRGLSVADADALRGRMLEKGARVQVAKKTLFRIAAREAGYPDVPEEMLGDQPIAFVFSFSDEVSGAKAAYDFGKSRETVELVGGVLNGNVLTMSDAVALAQIPGRETLLAMFAAMVRAPLQCFAGACSSTLSGFARAVKEYAGGKACLPVGRAAPVAG